MAGKEQRMRLRDVKPGDLGAYVRMRCDPVMMAELGGSLPRKGYRGEGCPRCPCCRGRRFVDQDDHDPAHQWLRSHISSLADYAAPQAKP
jgi:hypothetical protein